MGSVSCYFQFVKEYRAQILALPSFVPVRLDFVKGREGALGKDVKSLLFIWKWKLKLKLKLDDLAVNLVLLIDLLPS